VHWYCPAHFEYWSSIVGVDIGLNYAALAVPRYTLERVSGLYVEILRWVNLVVNALCLGRVFVFLSCWKAWETYCMKWCCPRRSSFLQTPSVRGTSTTALSPLSFAGLLCTGSSIRRFASFSHFLVFLLFLYPLVSVVLSFKQRPVPLVNLFLSMNKL